MAKETDMLRLESRVLLFNTSFHLYIQCGGNLASALQSGQMLLFFFFSSVPIIIRFYVCVLKHTVRPSLFSPRHCLFVIALIPTKEAVVTTITGEATWFVS